MSIRAITFKDLQVFPKLGLYSDFVQQQGIHFNKAAAAKWILSLALCLALNKWMGIEVFFLGLPGWFVAAIIYIVGSKLLQRNLMLQDKSKAVV